MSKVKIDVDQLRKAQPDNPVRINKVNRQCTEADDENLHPLRSMQVVTKYIQILAKRHP